MTRRLCACVFILRLILVKWVKIAADSATRALGTLLTSSAILIVVVIVCCIAQIAVTHSAIRSAARALCAVVGTIGTLCALA